MKHIFLIVLLLSFLFIFSGCNNPTSTNTTTTQTATATVEQSAFTSSVNSADNGTKYNAGYLEYLWVAPLSGSPPLTNTLKEAVYMKFILPSIPSGATIESATLNIRITTLDASCTTTITQVTSAWDKTTISVTNEPTEGSVAAYIISTDVGSNSFDITSLVRDWVGGTSANYGVKVFPSGASNGAGTDNLTRFSDHDDVQNYPRITIRYH